MIIIPAVDIRDGKCVRLFRGDFQRETVYSDDPVATAQRWVDQGAELLHVVDLDGARDGAPVNAPIIHRMLRSVSCPVEIGGGIRTEEDARTYLDAGAERIILGSAVAEGTERVVAFCARFPGRVVIGLDVKDNKLAVGGWTQLTSLTLEEALRRIESGGPRAIIYTEIVRDGTLAGPAVDGLMRVTSLTRIPVIASGGVRGLDDIRKLLPLASSGVEGVIVGKSIYAGTLDLSAAIAAAKGAP